MLRTIFTIVAAASVMSLAVAAEAPAADKKAKLCEKTGKVCTGGKNAAHNCKKGDKECSNDKVAAKHQCKEAAAKNCSENKSAAKHQCKKSAAKHQCKKAAAKANICEKTGKACTGGKNAAHNCKKGATECSKDKTAPAKK